MPSWELFDAQPAEYRDAVLAARRVTAAWAWRWASSKAGSDTSARHGRFVGMDRFGASAPAGVLLKHFGFTVENVVAAAKAT